MEGVVTFLAHQQQVFRTFTALRAVVKMMRHTCTNAAASFAPIVRPFADRFINLLVGYLGRMFDPGSEVLYWFVGEHVRFDVKHSR